MLEAIAETAFKASDLPLILSFENHCSYVPLTVCHAFASVCLHKELTIVQNLGLSVVLNLLFAVLSVTINKELLVNVCSC